MGSTANTVNAPSTIDKVSRVGSDDADTFHVSDLWIALSGHDFDRDAPLLQDRLPARCPDFVVRRPIREVPSGPFSAQLFGSGKVWHNITRRGVPRFPEDFLEITFWNLNYADLTVSNRMFRMNFFCRRLPPSVVARAALDSTGRNRRSSLIHSYNEETKVMWDSSQSTKLICATYARDLRRICAKD